MGRTRTEPEPVEAGGMWERDKEFGNRLDEVIPLRPLEAPSGKTTAKSSPFILWDVDVPEGRTIDTKLGDAQVAVLTVQMLGANGEPEGEKVEATTVASAIVDKCRNARASDLPAVVELRKVETKFENEGLVIQYVRDYDRTEGRAGKEPQPDDDIPF